MTHSEKCTCGAEFSIDATFMGTTAAGLELAEFRRRHTPCLVAWWKLQKQADNPKARNEG